MPKLNKTDFFPGAFFDHGDYIYTIKEGPKEGTYYGKVFSASAKWLHSTVAKETVSSIHTLCIGYLESVIALSIITQKWEYMGLGQKN